MTRTECIWTHSRPGIEVPDDLMDADADAVTARLARRRHRRNPPLRCANRNEKCLTTV